MSGPEDGAVRDLLAAVRSPMPDVVRTSVAELLVRDRALGVATAFDLLAGEPRLKPSTRLLIDPTDAVRTRWSCRVAAAGALLESAAVADVFAELYDELSDDRDLAADVLADAVPHPALGAERAAALRSLSG